MTDAAAAGRGASRMAALAKITALEQAVNMLTIEQKGHKTQIEDLQRQVEGSDIRNTKLAGANADLLRRVSELESWVDEREKDLAAVHEDDDENDSEIGEPNRVGLSEEQIRAVKASMEAAKSTEMKVRQLALRRIL